MELDCRNIQEETASYSNYDNIITVSKTAEISFKKVYGQVGEIATIYNPIDVDDIKISGNESIVEYNRDVPNIVTVGRLVTQKGYDILLKVMKKLNEDGFNFKLRILGEGEQKEELEDFIKQNHLQKNVELIGFKKNPYPYIASSDLFVCSSRSEGYSLVIAEALVLGIPVVSTYCSGPNELLGEGKYGMLLANNEEGTGLYEGLKQLLTDSGLLAIYEQKAIKRGNYFSLKRVMNEIEKLFY